MSGDAERFVDKTNVKFMMFDEEQSCIVEVTGEVSSPTWFDVIKRYYLGVAQAHLAHPDPELVEYVWAVVSNFCLSLRQVLVVKPFE